MDKKNYTIIEETVKYGKPHFIVKDKLTIKCEGGEKMGKEKSEIVFIKTEDIPKVLKGKTGRNWQELFESIPEGQTAIIPESYGTGATVRQAVKQVNAKLGKVTFKATQRTENDKPIVYVIRV